MAKIMQTQSQARNVDYRGGNQSKVMTLPVDEFIRRFCNMPSRPASNGFATMASWPTAIARPNSLSAANS
jgi:hypothetical protein